MSSPPTWNYPTPGPYGRPPAQGWTPGQGPQVPEPKRGLQWWAWLLIIGAGVLFLSCTGILAFVIHIGSVGPETKIYAGNEVPARFTDTMKQLQVLEPGEQIRYFYSDALKDIKQGFYFVSDRKVVVYIESAAKPTTVVKFDQIADAEISPSDSTWVDGSITLTLKDGTIVGFPVSSEQGRDKLFFKAIQESMPKGQSTKPEKE